MQSCIRLLFSLILVKGPRSCTKLSLIQVSGHWKPSVLVILLCIRQESFVYSVVTVAVSCHLVDHLRPSFFLTLS